MNEYFVKLPLHQNYPKLSTENIFSCYLRDAKALFKISICSG